MKRGQGMLSPDDRERRDALIMALWASDHDRQRAEISKLATERLGFTVSRPYVSRFLLSQGAEPKPGGRKKHEAAPPRSGKGSTSADRHRRLRLIAGLLELYPDVPSNWLAHSCALVLGQCVTGSMIRKLRADFDLPRCSPGGGRRNGGRRGLEAAA